ncbi:winged helix-turn-helix domain-containing protein [Enterobacter cloacae]|jgi:DNA-binding winged helix-turn-helix (wHTH) protein|uniref:Transcriptional regulator n=1 Tax=Enterobacter cloacae TaxID=550 RepID=A0A3R8ZVW8_ENTCL|nr:MULTISPECIES: winged helix-turn-helix domain-containing protein [Enterobacter]AFM57850.1 putative transcriptional regulatory protein [Enterobacter cloacae subsp. dissolvens SDM]EKU2874810.1 winged helix-turn-helix domain-containing protein [Enterobacter cloacae]ELE9014479.1 winged helix-turn-helix domain-containing protein [Enterobacter cloacae]ELE9706297.1 winged helix-turn-helix domain-containing protein [Enterobacter cloacae]ELK7336020.1 winged helix-turn-helix domain-containing protein 
MHKYYIINGVVEFHPAASTLRDLNNPEQVVVLNSPAGRCLLLLIERAGSIVTQQECMDIVWQRRGMMVSPNTYYQNISILRKGLKKVGFETDPIVTIPRIGLTLASDTQITIKETQLPSAEPDAPVQTVQEEVSVPQPVAPAVKRRIWLPGVLLGLLLFISVVVISHSRAHDNYFVDGYRFTTMMGECRLYFARDIETPHDRDKALSYAAPFKDECSSYPWVYISGYTLLPRASVIRCDRAMTEPNRCMSDYFIQDH